MRTTAEQRAGLRGIYAAADPGKLEVVLPPSGAIDITSNNLKKLEAQVRSDGFDIAVLMTAAANNLQPLLDDIDELLAIQADEVTP